MLLSTQQDAFYTLAAAGQKLRRELANVLQVRRSLLRLFKCGGCISRAYFRGLQRHHRVLHQSCRKSRRWPSNWAAAVA